MNKLTLVAAFLVLAYASSEYLQNPALEKPYHFIHKRVTVSPNLKNVDWERFLIPPKAKIPNTSGGTKTVANCGVPAFSEQRSIGAGSSDKIVGGTEAVPHSYPWQVACYIDNIYFCGGSIISEEWVLTAGHCLHNAGYVDVVMGAHNINQFEVSQRTVRSTDLTVHEDYQPLIIHNDVALAKMATITFNNYIMPVCLPAYSDVFLPVGTIVTPTGWGLMSDTSNDLSDTLNEVDVPVMDYDTCNNYYGTINDGIICIDSTGDHGTCSGDSGGPLNLQYSDGKYYTRGIVSFGSSAGCDSGAPDAFTRVEYYLDWISLHTGIAIDP